MDDKPYFRPRHIYTQEIMRILRAMEPGQIIEYSALNKVVGIDTRAPSRGYGYQKTARDILERDEGMVFQAIDAVGLRRMTPEEVALTTGTKHLNQRRALTKRNLRRIGTVDEHFDALTPEAQEKATFARTILIFDREMGMRKNIAKIEKRVREAKKLIEFDSTISLFSK